MSIHDIIVLLEYITYILKAMEPWETPEVNNTVAAN